MVTNITGLQGAENLFELVEYANVVSNNLFTGLFVIAIFVILTLVLVRRSEPVYAIWTASFISLGMSFFLGLVNMVSIHYIIGFILLFVFTTIYVYVTKR